MMLKWHTVELLLAVLALLGVAIFIVLHIIIQPAGEVWWILAVSTLILALSDAIMHVRSRQ